MNFEKPPQKSDENPGNNMNERRFTQMPGEAESEEEKQALDERLSEANEKLQENQREKQKEIQRLNEKFLEDHSGIASIVDEYEEKLGNAFAEQKDEILTNLRNFVEGKTGVDMENPQEKQALEETLKNKLSQEIEQRFKEAL